MSETIKKPRIGIIGTGAIGGFYGLMLARAGYDVHFLLRSEFSAVSQHGLRLDSQVHGVLTLDNVQAYSSAADMPACDWLLVGAKTTGNDGVAPAIIQAAAPNAKVLMLQNGLAVEDELRALLPDSLHLLGGLCFICVHRTGPGQIAHQAFGALNIGYHSGPAANAAASLAIVEEGAALFHAAGIESVAMDNLDKGLSVLLNASTTPLMADADSRELIQGLMAEVVQGAQACGHVLPQGYAEQLFKVTGHMPDYRPSMHHDFSEKRPLELEAIYAKPLAAALAAGCDMPKIRALYHALAFIDRGNR
jgi:2-dehydropantoate 2-reductase